mgnify:CR=1 FL=1
MHVCTRACVCLLTTQSINWDWGLPKAARSSSRDRGVLPPECHNLNKRPSLFSRNLTSQRTSLFSPSPLRPPPSRRPSTLPLSSEDRSFKLWDLSRGFAVREGAGGQ